MSQNPMPDEREAIFEARYSEHDGKWFWAWVAGNMEVLPDERPAEYKRSRITLVPKSSRESAEAERDEALRELDRWRPDDAMTNAPRLNPTIIGLEAEVERWKRPVEAFLLAKGEGHKQREAAAIDAMHAALTPREDA